MCLCYIVNVHNWRDEMRARQDRQKREIFIRILHRNEKVPSLVIFNIKLQYFQKSSYEWTIFSWQRKIPMSHSLWYALCWVECPKNFFRWKIDKLYMYVQVRWSCSRNNFQLSIVAVYSKTLSKMIKVDLLREILKDFFAFIHSCHQKQRAIEEI